MSIQHCPDEVLDMIFQLLPFQSPDTTLLPTLLTCRRFCAIAICHLTRVVCLESAERVNLFAAYLTQLINAGAYGSALLPIEHLAAFGNPQPTQYKSAHEAAESILPFIISIAAPSLRSLTIFGFGSRYTPGGVDGMYVRNSVRFPKLQWLVLLEQHIISLQPTGIQNGGDRFPRLTSLYTHRGCINYDVSALHTLRELRLHILLRGPLDCHPPYSPNLRIETIIIDAPPYQSSIGHGCVRWDQTRSRYQAYIEDYHEFIKTSSSSSESSVIMAKAVCVRPKLVLGAWKDIVQGGSGYWKKGWGPTTDEGLVPAFQGYRRTLRSWTSARWTSWRGKKRLQGNVDPAP